MPITDAENKAHRRYNVKLRNLKRKNPLCLRCCKNKAKKREDGSAMSLCIECTTERAERIACERARKKAEFIKATKKATKQLTLPLSVSARGNERAP